MPVRAEILVFSTVLMRYRPSKETGPAQAAAAATRELNRGSGGTRQRTKRRADGEYDA